MSSGAERKRRRYQLLRDVAVPRQAVVKKGDIYPGEPLDVMRSSPADPRRGEFGGQWIRLFVGQRIVEVPAREVREVPESPETGRSKQ
jgi:hypothetical protein